MVISSPREHPTTSRDHSPTAQIVKKPIELNITKQHKKVTVKKQIRITSPPKEELKRQSQLLKLQKCIVLRKCNVSNL